jgi:hypothetical protein
MQQSWTVLVVCELSMAPIHVACAALLDLQEVTYQKATRLCPMQGPPHLVALTDTSSSCTSRWEPPGTAELTGALQSGYEPLVVVWTTMLGDREGGSGDKALAPCIHNHMCQPAVPNSTSGCLCMRTDCAALAAEPLHVLPVPLVLHISPFMHRMWLLNVLLPCVPCVHCRTA